MLLSNYLRRKDTTGGIKGIHCRINTLAGDLTGKYGGRIQMGMDELSEEDKLTVSRARKVQRFLSQSFSVAEQFTGMPGQYVPLKETLRGFKMILDGECDSIPESCFLFAGTIDDVFEKAKNNQNQ